MNESKLKELLQQLNAELDQTEKVDSDTATLLRELEDDLDRLIDPETEDSDFDSVITQAQALETRFAAEHPTAERFLREIVNILARVGI